MLIIIAVFLILIPIGLGLVSDFVAKQIGTNPKDTLTVFFIGYICFLHDTCASIRASLLWPVVAFCGLLRGAEFALQPT